LGISYPQHSRRLRRAQREEGEKRRGWKKKWWKAKRVAEINNKGAAMGALG